MLHGNLRNAILYTMFWYYATLNRMILRAGTPCFFPTSTIIMYITFESDALIGNYLPLLSPIYRLEISDGHCELTYRSRFSRSSFARCSVNIITLHNTLLVIPTRIDNNVTVDTWQAYDTRGRVWWPRGVPHDRGRLWRPATESSRATGTRRRGLLFQIDLRTCIRAVNSRIFSQTVWPTHAVRSSCTRVNVVDNNNGDGDGKKIRNRLHASDIFKYATTRIWYA